MGSEYCEQPANLAFYVLAYTLTDPGSHHEIVIDGNTLFSNRINPGSQEGISQGIGIDLWAE